MESGSPVLSDGTAGPNLAETARSRSARRRAAASVHPPGYPSEDKLAVSANRRDAAAGAVYRAKGITFTGGETGEKGVRVKVFVRRTGTRRTVTSDERTPRLAAVTEDTRAQAGHADLSARWSERRVAAVNRAALRGGTRARARRSRPLLLRREEPPCPGGSRASPGR